MKTGNNSCNSTLVLGIGNPILRDDGVGHIVVEELQKIISHPDISFKTTNLAGISLMEMIAGFKYLIVVDAIINGGNPGDVYHLNPEDFEFRSDSFISQHKVGVLEAVELGKSLNQSMPSRVDIVAVEVKDAADFGESLTPEVQKAVPLAVEKICQMLLTVNS